MKRLALISCFALAALVPATAETREIEARPGEELTVDLQTGAQLEITGWSRDLVAVEAEFTGKDRDDIEFTVRRISGGVEILSDYRARKPNRNSGGTIRVRVPARFDLNLNSMGGGIEIEGVDGRISGETMGGQMMLRGLRGEVNLTTMGGNIKLTDSEVDGKLETYGGNVTIRDVIGNVEGATMGGRVTYDNVQPSPSSAGDGREVKITTMGGDIDAPNAPHGASLETMGGDIHIEYAGKYVKAKTMGGNITIESVDGWVKATTMAGDLNVRMTGDPREGKRDVRLISMTGDVDLTLPDGMSMEIDITVAYTKHSSRNYKIDSDFPLAIKESPTWEYENGSPRKRIHGSAVAGDGEHRIKIETVNGNVRLRRGS